MGLGPLAQPFTGDVECASPFLSTFKLASSISRLSSCIASDSFDLSSVILSPFAEMIGINY
jgi:hypothetical protein